MVIRALRRLCRPARRRDVRASPRRPARRIEMDRRRQAFPHWRGRADRGRESSKRLAPFRASEWPTRECGCRLELIGQTHSRRSPGLPSWRLSDNECRADIEDRSHKTSHKTMKRLAVCFDVRLESKLVAGHKNRATMISEDAIDDDLIPGRGSSRRDVYPCGHDADAGSVNEEFVGRPRSTTLVSPVTIETPALSAASRMLAATDEESRPGALPRAPFHRIDEAAALRSSPGR
jgi:hypothetical protein